MHEGEVTQPEPPPSTEKQKETDWDALLDDFVKAESSVKAATAAKESLKDRETASVVQIGALVADTFDTGGVEAVKKLEGALSENATPLKKASVAKPAKTTSVKTAK